MQQITPLAVAGRSSTRPFVGRVQELADLASALEEAASGRGSLVLLTGEPGIGKTRLMSELARVAGAARRAGRHGSLLGGGRRAAVLAVDAGHPLAGRRSRGARSCRRLACGAARGSRARSCRRAGGIRLFDAVGASSPPPPRERPLLVMLDDVHAADEPSLLLLRFLGDALAEARVLLVASYREAERRVRELADVFAELARVGRRIPLRGLTSADIEAYVATVTGSQPTRRAVARLHEITGGNPFFLGEVVRLLAADDTLESLDERPGIRSCAFRRRFEP